VRLSFQKLLSQEAADTRNRMSEIIVDLVICERVERDINLSLLSHECQKQALLHIPN